MYKFENCPQLKYVLSILNPFNAHPTHSRFESFFKNEERTASGRQSPETPSSPTVTNKRSKEAVSPANARQHPTFHFNIDRVIQGNDRRTTVMIKNISRSLSKERLRIILSSYCELNYIYIPTNAKNKILGFAFVNVINSEELIKLYETLQRQEESSIISSKKAADVCYSKMQGINELAKAFGEII